MVTAIPAPTILPRVSVGGVEGVSLRIAALGAAEVFLNGARVDGKLPAKAVALLVYLADHDGVADRARVASLLWSDQVDSQARSNLRVTLTRLRSALGDAVQADRNRIWIAADWEIDIHQPIDVERLIADGGVSLTLLDGWDGTGATVFEDWLSHRRSMLQSVQVNALKSYARSLSADDDWAGALRASNRLVQIDPWSEEGHRILIEALANVDSRPVALAHFDRFERSLAHEFGVSPEPETVRLIDRVNNARQMSASREHQVEESRSGRTWQSSFVGRSTELAELEDIVRAGHVVSIVGPGGIGKTRVMSALMETLRARGRALIFASFEDLELGRSENDEHAFAKHLLTEMRVDIDQSLGPFRTLVAHVGSGEQVMCLDNVEVLEDVEELLGKLLRQCPNVAVVATTRRQLQLVSGTTFRLDGLSTDSDGDGEPPALRLFLDRVSGDLDVAERGQALEVCRHVDGHPLAIELAAQWTSTTPLENLMEALASGPGLATRAPDLPDRQRNLDSVVAASVERVSPTARETLDLVSFFAAQFTRGDLEALGIDIERDVVELVEHSLLAVDSRAYSMHPLIKRFVRSRLTDRDLAAEYRSSHAEAILRGLNQQRVDYSHNAWKQIAEDLRLAIEHHIEVVDPEALHTPLVHYLGLLRTWGWNETASQTIVRALGRHDLPARMRAELYRHDGEAFLHAGRTVDAGDSLRRGLEVLGETMPSTRWGKRRWVARQAMGTAVANIHMNENSRGDAAERARIMSLLGEVYYVSDRREEMIMFGLGSFRAGRLSQDAHLMAAGDAALSITAQLAGAHRISDRYCQRAREKMQQSTSLVDDFTGAETLGILALVDAGAGRSSQAREGIALALSASAASGRTRHAAQLTILEALIDQVEGQPGIARKRLDALEPDVRRSGFGRGLAWVLATQVEVALARDDFDTATTVLPEALSCARQFGAIEDEARVHVAAARLALLEGRGGEAARRLEQAREGLESDGALAIQYSDAHAGAAVIASLLESYLTSSTSRSEQRRFDRFARKVPSSLERFGPIEQVHATAFSQDRF